MQSDQDYQELLTLLASDLNAYFPELVMKYDQRLYRFVCRYLREPHEAEDVVQTVMANAYFALKEYSPERILELSLSGWLYTIARNECSRVEAKKRRIQPVSLTELEEEMEDNVNTNLESLIETRTRLNDALEEIKRLPTHYREPLILYLIDGLKMGEIAQLLNKPCGTVKSTIYRGLTRLRRSLEKDSWSDRSETR